MRCDSCDEKMSRLGRQREVFCDCGESEHENVCKTCCDSQKGKEKVIGCYINPEEYGLKMTKEEWLKKYAVPTTIEDIDNKGPMHSQDVLPVAWIDNGNFTAAAVVYNAGEWQAFSYPDEERSRKFYWVAIEALLKVSELEEYLIWTRKSQKEEAKSAKSG